jgi:hypothetical protein
MDSDYQELADSLNQVGEPVVAEDTPVAPAPPVAPQVPPQPPAPPAPLPEPSGKVDPKRLAEYAEMFRQVTGFSPEDFAEIARKGVEQQVQSEKAKLESEWGFDYEPNFEAVKQEFAQLPQDPSVRKFFNTAEGAKLLLERARMNGRLSTIAKERSAGTPNYRLDSSSRAPGNRTAFLFRQSELEAMPLPDYQKHSNAIIRAYQEGRVDLQH